MKRMDLCKVNAVGLVAWFAYEMRDVPHIGWKITDWSEAMMPLILLCAAVSVAGRVLDIW